jgi:uncharacterized protein YodC (DUF2158 family)
MATKFTKGQEVTINAVIPKGPVSALRMDENGDFFYQIEWSDAKGVTQQRWFSEAELVEA